jgi:hypothetical protein
LGPFSTSSNKKTFDVSKITKTIIGNKAINNPGFFVIVIFVECDNVKMLIAGLIIKYKSNKIQKKMPFVELIDFVIEF